MLTEGNDAISFIIRIAANVYNLDVMIKLYNAMVRSKAECAAVMWNPYFQSRIQRLEVIQIRFVPNLYYNNNFNIHCSRNVSTVALRFFDIIDKTRRHTFSLLISTTLLTISLIFKIY